MGDHKKRFIAVVTVLAVVLVLFLGFQTVTQKMAFSDGNKYLGQKEYEKAYSAFVKAEKKKSFFTSKTEIRYYEGECLLYLERFDEAVKVYDKISDTRALALKGFAYQRNGNKKQAKSCYLEAIDKDEKDGVGYYYLYAFYVDQGNYKKALKVINSAQEVPVTKMKQDIDFAKIVVYEKMLDYDTARIEAGNYVATYPDDERGKQELAFLETR